METLIHGGMLTVASAGHHPEIAIVKLLGIIYHHDRD
jgi:hypothetical protein